jgi:peptidoglycan L-alanyl-D-glutamate endopeptidase CwlK
MPVLWEKGSDMSSRKIEDLVSSLQEKYRLFEAQCHASGLDFIVTCTTRSIAEQAELVKEGKSRTMHSKHLTGEAFDFCPVIHGKLSWVFKDFVPIGKIAEDLGLEWGGCKTGKWEHFVDAPHVQLKS